MKDYVLLYNQDVKKTVSLFRTLDAHGRLIVRPELQDLCCAKCGKFDESVALKRSAVNFTVKTKRDVLSSADDLYVISQRMRDVLESIHGVQIAYYEFLNTRDYYVGMPQMIWPARKDDAAFRTFAECSVCGRFADAVWGSGHLQIKDDIELGAVHLENRHGVMPVWFVSLGVAEILTAEKLSGLFLDRDRLKAIK